MSQMHRSNFAEFPVSPISNEQESSGLEPGQFFPLEAPLTSSGKSDSETLSNSSYSTITNRNLRKNKIGEEQLTNYCSQLFNPFDDVAMEKNTRLVRAACVEKFADFDGLKYFRLGYSDRQGNVQPFTDPMQVVNLKSFFTFYSILANHTPDEFPAPKHFIERVLDKIGKDKLLIVVYNRYDGPFAGFYIRGTDYISLVDQLSLTSGQSGRENYASGSFDANSIYHEMAHLWMNKAYGRSPDYEGPAHNLETHSVLNAFTNKEAAWSEGFANGLSSSCYGAGGENETVLFYQNPEWSNLPLEKKIENEYVIGTIIKEYIGHGVWDTSRIDRMDKILNTLETGGFQTDFTEFVTDFLSLYPEEEDRFVKILSDYGLSDAHVSENN